jgi:hypothetical protein
MNASQELEILDWNLCSLDSKLVVQLALCSSLDACDSFSQFGTTLARNTKRVRAACVGPHIGEGDLFRGTLLNKQFILGVEEKDGESAVEKSFVDICH